MIFTSKAFVVFLLLLFIIYFLTEKVLPKFQWVILLFFSMFFYAYLSRKYLLYILLPITTSWIYGLLIGHIKKRFDFETEKPDRAAPDYKERKKLVKHNCEIKKKIMLTVVITINLAVLVYVKYANNLFVLLGKDVEGVIVPLGISFYTFMSIGYCIDVFREVVVPLGNPFKLALYVSYFPHISQGPIGHFEKLGEQLFTNHSFEYDRFVKGLIRILFGYFKKIIIANNLAQIVDPVFDNYRDYHGLSFVFATLMYAIQLYADFSGYMDISLGASSCLGITLEENFETPYFSTNISEYWRKWHITLGAWFRDYLYYPILRNKKFSSLNKKLRKSGHKNLARYLTTSIGLLITWGCIGIWHGTTLNYMVHALWHAFFIILGIVLEDKYAACRRFFKINEKSRMFKCFQIVRTFLIVNIGYVFFRSNDLREALYILRAVFTDFSGGFLSLIGSFDKSFFTLISIGVIVLIAIDIIDLKKGFFKWFMELPIVFRYAILYLVAFLVLVYSFEQPVSSGAFLYFDF